MGIKQTTNYGLAYIDELTSLTAIAEATRLTAENLEAAMTAHGSQQPPSFTPARGNVIEALRTTPLTAAANQSGALLITEGTGTVLAGRRYRASLMVPQAGGAATDRLSLRLQAGPDASPVDVQATYAGLNPVGAPMYLASKRLTFPAGTARIRAYAVRDVGTAAWSLYADTVSNIVLSLDDIGAAA